MGTAAILRLTPGTALTSGRARLADSSVGDPSCLYDSANGGHWFFTQIVSASPESAGGPFAGCFLSGPAAVANACYEGIAVTQGSSPFGPYNVYFLHADYNPAEPGYPYVSAAHEELEFPAIAAGARNGRAIMSFTLSGNGGEFFADNGGFYPSSAFGRLTSTSRGLLASTINIADLGQSPYDALTEYQGYPGATLLPRPRWGDYGNAIFSGGKVYFASEYIQYPKLRSASVHPHHRHLRRDQERLGKLGDIGERRHP